MKIILKSEDVLEIELADGTRFTIDGEGSFSEETSDPPE